MQVSGLWKNTSANGDMYLQGKLGNSVRILIFKNKYKTADNQPDYQIYFAPVERREGEAQGQTRAAEEDDFLGAPGGAHANEEEDFAPGQRRETPQEKAERAERAWREHETPRVEAERLLDSPPARDEHYAPAGQPAPEIPRPAPAPPARSVDRLAGKGGPPPARVAAGSHRRTTPEPVSSSSEDFGEMEDPFAD